MPFGIDRDAGHFAEIHVGRQPKRTGRGVEWNGGRRCLLLRRHRPGQQQQSDQPTLHHILPLFFIASDASREKVLASTPRSAYRSITRCMTTAVFEGANLNVVSATQARDVVRARSM